jgi:hypothetical protein
MTDSHATQDSVAKIQGPPMAEALRDMAIERQRAARRRAFEAGARMSDIEAREFRRASPALLIGLLDQVPRESTWTRKRMELWIATA